MKQFSQLDDMMTFAEDTESELFLSMANEDPSLLDLSPANQDLLMGTFYAHLDAKSAGSKCVVPADAPMLEADVERKLGKRMLYSGRRLMS